MRTNFAVRCEESALDGHFGRLKFAEQIRYGQCSVRIDRAIESMIDPIRIYSNLLGRALTFAGRFTGVFLRCIPFGQQSGWSRVDRAKRPKRRTENSSHLTHKIRSQFNGNKFFGLIRSNYQTLLGRVHEDGGDAATRKRLESERVVQMSEESKLMNKLEKDSTRFLCGFLCDSTWRKT